MKNNCPNFSCACPGFIIKDGKFKRHEDSKFIQRFRCKSCGTRFSSATFTPTYYQKRRRVNAPLLKLISSGVSSRRSAYLLGVSRRTVEKKLPFLANRCQKLNTRYLNSIKGRIHNIQIDDLITKENSKLRLISVSIAVDERRRTILSLEVSLIPAFGHLARQVVRKYGIRKDEHFETNSDV